MCDCRRASRSILSILGIDHSLLCLDIRCRRRLGCLCLPKSAILCSRACLWGWQGQQLFPADAKALRQKAGVLLGLVHLQAQSGKNEAQEQGFCCYTVHIQVGSGPSSVIKLPCSGYH